MAYDPTTLRANDTNRDEPPSNTGSGGPNPPRQNPPGQPNVTQPTPTGPPPNPPTGPNAPPTTTTSHPRYNTTPNWQDPNSAPTPGDPYWNEWFAANPTYKIPTGSGSWPGTTIQTRGGGTFVVPRGDASDADIIAFLKGLTPDRYSGIDPSVSSDPDYWLKRFRQTNGQNVDWGYWTDRFYGQGHTAEGPSGGGNHPPPTGDYGPVDPNLTGNYGDVLNLVKQRFQQWYGRPITDAEIANLQQMFHYTPDTAASQGTLSTSQKVANNASYTGQQALDYLNQQSQALRGSALSQDEINQAISKIGYQQGQPITGTQLNQLLGSLDTLATNRTGASAGNTVTYHGSDVNPVLQYLYNHRNAGGPGGGGTGGGGTGGGGTGGGGTGGTGTGGPGPEGSMGSNSLLAMLLGRATQSLNIDPFTDPIIREQVDAARRQTTQTGRDTINDYAESSNPYTTGALNNIRAQTTEKGSQHVSDIQAQLVQQELQARRGEISQALQEMGSQLTSQQQLALQSQLGILDAALRQQGVTNQNSQFYSGLGQNQDQFLKNLLLQYGYLNSQNDQFAANYNLNATNLANYWDSIRRGLLQ